MLKGSQMENVRLQLAKCKGHTSIDKYKEQLKKKHPLGCEELTLKSLKCSFTCTNGLRLELTLSLFFRVMLVVRNLHVYIFKTLISKAPDKERTTVMGFEPTISCVTGKRFKPLSYTVRYLGQADYQQHCQLRQQVLVVRHS